MENYKVDILLDKIGLLRKIYFYKNNQDCKLHQGQMKVMEFIKNNEGCTQVEVSEKLMITPASVAVSTKKLEQIGLIEKKGEKNNLRIKRLFLTEEGINQTNKGIEFVEETYKTMFKDFSNEELFILKGYLDRIFKNLINCDERFKDMDIFEMVTMMESFHKNRHSKKEGDYLCSKD